MSQKAKAAEYTNQAKKAAESKQNRRAFIALAIILFLAAAIRIHWIHHIDPNLYPQSILSGNEHFLGWDGVWYDRIAKNMLDGASYGYHPNKPDAWRPPGYPFFLFAIYKIFGHHYAAVRWIQTLMSCFVAALLFFLTRDMTRSNLAGLLAAFVYSIDYYSVMFTSIFYSEPFAAFLCLVSIYLFREARKKSGSHFCFLFIAACLFFWFTVLTRPSNILFWAWIGLWWLIVNRKNLGRSFAGVTFIILTFTVVVLPWTFRNYQLYGKFLLISSNGGSVFFMAHHPKSAGVFIGEDNRYTDKQKKELKGLDRVDWDKQHYRYALQFIKTHPKRVFQLMWIKQLWLWLNRENRGAWIDFLTGIRFPLVTFYFLALSALAGLVLSIKNWGALHFVLGYILFHAASISFIYFYDGPRTRMSMVPFLAVFSGIAFAKIWNGLRKFWVSLPS